MENYFVELTLVPSDRDSFKYIARLMKSDGKYKEMDSFGREVVKYKNPSLVWTGEYYTGTGWLDVKILFASGKIDKYSTNLVIQDVLNGKLDPRYKNKLKKPSVKDIIHSLVTDYQAIDCATYEDFADNFGYGRDSREGEKVYQACLKQSLQLRAALGEAEIVRLQELLRDY